MALVVDDERELRRFGTRTLADAAIDGSATVAEIVDVLVEIIPVVGLPRAVAEAPKLALAVGYDTEEAFEARSGP